MDKEMNIDEIIPYSRNAKKHSKQQIDLIAKSIKEFGFRQPIVIDKNKEIIIGHARLEAAKQLGMKEVPVIDASDLTPQQVKALRLADNKLAELAQWDMDLAIEELKGLDDNLVDLTGFDRDLLIEPDEKDDVIPENVPARSKLGDLYELGRHRVLCGDSMQQEAVLRLMDGKKADMVFTSPPYSDMRVYNNNKDLEVKTLIDFIPIYKEFSDFFVINLGLQRKDGEVFCYWDDYIKKARECGLKFLSWNIWDRHNAQTIAQQTALFGIEHEWLFIFGNKKEIKRTVANKEPGKVHTSGNRGKNDNMELRVHKTNQYKQLGTILRCESSKSNKTGHPAVFPVELPVAYLKACVNDNLIVIDPFLGSGTTLIASEKTERICYGMELDEKYVDVIIKRWEDYTGKKAELVT